MRDIVSQGGDRERARRYAVVRWLYEGRRISCISVTSCSKTSLHFGWRIDRRRRRRRRHYGLDATFELQHVYHSKRHPSSPIICKHFFDLPNRSFMTR